MQYEKYGVIIGCFVTVGLYAGSVTKPRVSNVKESAGQVRCKILQESENILKNVSSLIKEEASCIDDVVEAIKSIASDEGEFMTLTLAEKKVYLQKLETISSMLEQRIDELHTIRRNITLFKK